MVWRNHQPDSVLSCQEFRLMFCASLSRGGPSDSRGNMTFCPRLYVTRFRNQYVLVGVCAPPPTFYRSLRTMTCCNDNNVLELVLFLEEMHRVSLEIIWPQDLHVLHTFPRCNFDELIHTGEGAIHGGRGILCWDTTKRTQPPLYFPFRVRHVKGFVRCGPIGTLTCPSLQQQQQLQWEAR